MPPVDEHKRHELFVAMEDLIGAERAETFMSMLPPTTWDDLVTKEYLSREFELFEHKIMGLIHREFRSQTRALMLGLIGAMATMTSLCLGTITLLQ